MKRILSLGSVYLDTNVTNFPFPPDANQLLNTETVGSNYEIVLGGSAVNFVRFCTILGLSTVFIGKTGKDIASESLIKLFEKEKTAPLLVSSSHVQTNSNTNLVGGNTSLMLSFGNANQSLSFDEVDKVIKENINAFDILYLGGLFKLKNILPRLDTVVAFVKSKGKKVVVDHGRLVNTTTDKEKDAVRHVIEASDYYLPSRQEFLELWSVESIEEGLKLFIKTSLTVVVKDGEYGAHFLKGNASILIPSYNIEPLNTIGAGDAFNAGFITAQSDGKTLEESIRFANATAALKISSGKFPSKDAIHHLLQEE